MISVSISCVVPKVFENCILKIFDHYFKIKANQFGFKKLYSTRSLTKLTEGGSTVNICSLDLSKHSIKRIIAASASKTNQTFDSKL